MKIKFIRAFFIINYYLKMKMEKKYNEGFNLKDHLKTDIRSHNLNLRLNTNPSKKSTKEDILSSHKLSLEFLLNLIKSNQLEYVSTHHKKEVLKIFLTSLKDNLDSNLHKKNKIYKSLKTENESIKTKIKKKIFSNAKNSVEKNNEKINPITEIEQLKNLNFEIENEISNIDFLIEHKNKIKLNIKNSSLNKEKDIVFCNYKNDKNISEVSDILNDNINQIKKNYNIVLIEKQKKEKEINTIKRKIDLTKEDIDDKFNNSVLKEEIIENTESTLTSQRITNFSEKWKNKNNKYLTEINNFKSDTSNLMIKNNIIGFNINKDLGYKTKTNVRINRIFNNNINDVEIHQKENNDCKNDDENEDHKSFNSSQYSESLEEEIELEQEQDEKDEIYSIKKINSPRCLSYDNSNTENSKNESDNEDEPEELILDINEEPDFMFTNICERGYH